MTGADNPANAGTATINSYLGQNANTYGPASNLTSLAAGEITSAGGSQAHLNMQPFLVLNFSIALQGIFPSQT